LFELGKKKPKAAATTATTATAAATTATTATATATASSCYMKTPEIHPEFPEFPDISDSLFSPCAIPPGVWIFRSEFPEFPEYVGDCNIQHCCIPLVYH